MARVRSLPTAPEDTLGETGSRLLDMRDCAGESYRAIHADMLLLALSRQPAWFRPLLVRSRRLARLTGYDHWSRAWEYPWAIEAAGLEARPLRTLDVGGGGSPFATYLARLGHEAFVVDPSMDQGARVTFDRQKGLYRNARSLAKSTLFRVTGISPLWGLPATDGSIPVRYSADRADDLKFPDAHFDRVFCLSVIEHITRDLWPRCMSEFERVLGPGGRLVITLDMETSEANVRLYQRLIDASSLRLIGDPRYEVPLRAEDQQARHPGHGYETIGLVWRKEA